MRVTLRILLLVILISSSLVGHPFDQERSDTSSQFTVNNDNVSLVIKIPLIAYVNIWVKTQKEYDLYANSYNAKVESKKIKKYVKELIRIFDGDKQIKLTISSITYQKDPYLIDSLPVSMKVYGNFKAKTKIKNLYIFNQLFKGKKAKHVGEAEIEVNDKLYDFVFNDNNYFQVEVK